MQSTGLMRMVIADCLPLRRRLLGLRRERRRKDAYSTGQVSWILIVAFALSLLYELYRSTAKNGVSRYDSMRSFLTRADLLRDRLCHSCAAAYGMAMGCLAALAVGVGSIIVSIFDDSPIVLRQRKPGPIHWLEDKLYTGLRFVAVALVSYDLLGDVGPVAGRVGDIRLFGWLTEGSPAFGAAGLAGPMQQLGEVSAPDTRTPAQAMEALLICGV